MRVIVCLLFFCFLSTARADWVHVTESVVFPPSVTETSACNQAMERAKQSAIRLVAGESLTSQEWMHCAETEAFTSQDGEVCRHDTTVWLELGGAIRATRELHTHTKDEVPGYRRCEVSLEADVSSTKRSGDPGFTLDVHLNNTVFRSGDLFELVLTPNQPMDVAVFLWLPYEKTTHQIHKIFPNEHQPMGHVAGALTFPDHSYQIQVGFPDLPTKTKVVNEYLMVVASRLPLKLSDTYEVDGFSELMAQLAPQDTRLIRRSYAIIGEP